VPQLTAVEFTATAASDMILGWDDLGKSGGGSLHVSFQSDATRELFRRRLTAVLSDESRDAMFWAAFLRGKGAPRRVV